MLDLVPSESLHKTLPEPWRSAYADATARGTAALAVAARLLALSSGLDADERSRRLDEIIHAASRYCEGWLLRVKENRGPIVPETMLACAAHQYTFAAAELQLVLDQYAAALEAGTTGETLQ